MSDLCDKDLIELLVRPGLIHDNGLSPAGWIEKNLVNSASIDVRVGFGPWKAERRRRFWERFKDFFRRSHALELSTWEDVHPRRFGLIIKPGESLLVPLLEHVEIPNGYVAELKLKSSTARQGWDHRLAFWVDPGWSGILTMEISNDMKWTSLHVHPGQRFAQLIVRKASGLSDKPYRGRYYGATKVEAAKS